MDEVPEDAKGTGDKVRASPGTRAHGSSPSEERVEQAWQELGLVSSCREPRAGYSELPINVTLVTEEEHS